MEANTLQAKDLRKGNIVKLLKNGRKHIEAYELSSFDIYKLDESNCDDVEPIPLSEDILLKLGFEKIREGKFIHLDLQGYNLVKGNGFYLSYVRPEIKYIHQLQNIFHSLTSEELTIKE